MNIEKIENLINKIPDYPKPGILFYDISTLIFNKDAFSSCINYLAEIASNYEFDHIASIDARGFIFGSALAYKLDKGLIMIRKKGKLPGKVISHTYELEYGSDTLEINVDAKEKKIALVDDLLATGGTASAAINLIEKSGGFACCFFSIIQLDFLKGFKKINIPTETLIHY
ncbi:MAG: adenine phosphoribosyltransferase [Rickettsiales bacterium]|nr:adenine phosphoribosyltransferase [Rickettsiales bacterium]